MIVPQQCPKCKGAILNCGSPLAVQDDCLCVNCGWRPQHVPEHIASEVEENLGKKQLPAGYTSIGTGNPPLSGWERKKRAEERQREIERKSA